MSVGSKDSGMDFGICFDVFGTFIRSRTLAAKPSKPLLFNILKNIIVDDGHDPF